MDKITKEHIARYLAESQVPLLPTQQRLCVPIIDRMCRKMMAGIRFDDIRVFDGWVLDGHHRYFASLLVGSLIGSVPGQKTAATVGYEWDTIVFDENDWDTPAKIRHVNELDAAFNNIPLAQIEAITQ